MKKTLTLLLSISSFCGFAQKARLVLNLQKDSVYNVTEKMRVDIRPAVPGGEAQKAVIMITGTTAHKVVAVLDTAYDMEASYKNLIMSIQRQGQTMVYNSSDSSSVMGQLFACMLNHPFHIVMSKRGEIMAIKDFEKVFNGLKEKFPQLSDQQMALLTEQVSQSFGEKALKENFQQAFIVYPKAGIALKGTWKGVVKKEQSGINYKFGITYTLNKWDADMYEIAGIGITLPEPVPPFKVTGKQFLRVTDTKGSSKSIIQADKKTGWVISAESSSHILAQMQIKETEKGPVTMTVPMVGDISYTITGK